MKAQTARPPGLGDGARAAGARAPKFVSDNHAARRLSAFAPGSPSTRELLPVDFAVRGSVAPPANA